MKLKLLFWPFGAFVFLLFSCKNEARLPDNAREPIPVTIARFDKDFFSLDTNAIDHGLQALSEKYPDFFPGYLTAILGIDPRDPQATETIKGFLQSYQPVFNQAAPVANDYLPTLKPEFENALQWLRYYLPSFRPDSPFVVTTFVGPMDAFESFSVGDYGDVRTSNGIGVALQLHLGADAEVYTRGMQTGIFYNYQVKRFTPQTILVNGLKNVVEDLFPYHAAGRPLVEEMVEKGKRIYLLKKILPSVQDSLILGYTGEQVRGCFENESLIWNFFVKNDLLYGIEPTVNQQYIRDGPKTPELGEASPGYVGLFAGWRIVEAYMKKNVNLSMEKLMVTPANTIFQGSSYRP